MQTGFSCQQVVLYGNPDYGNTEFVMMKTNESILNTSITIQSDMGIANDRTIGPTAVFAGLLVKICTVWIGLTAMSWNTFLQRVNLNTQTSTSNTRTGMSGLQNHSGG